MTRKTYYYIYKIECLVTNKFYIGKHTSHTLENDYLGSGKLIKLSVKKHGRHNHVKTILHTLNSLQELNDKEREIVNEHLLKDNNCLNLVLGGSGGWEGRSKIASEKGTLFTLGMKGKKHKTSTKKIISEKSKGKNNSQYGKRVYVNPETGEKTKRISIQPPGWILVSEWILKNKSPKYQGKKHWYNDGINDYFLDEDKASHLKLGRINVKFKQRKL